MQPPEHRQGGLVLVVVLWVLAILTLMALGYSASVRTDTRLAARGVLSLQARALAEAGILHAVATRLAGPGARSGTPPALDHYQFDLNGHAVHVGIRHEAGRIDLNTAYPELIQGMLRSVGLAAGRQVTLSDAILDWLDRDGLRRNRGAEDAEYRRAGATHDARDGPFNSADELLHVLGIDAQLYQRLADVVTVHSLSPGVYAAAAPRAVLLALPGAVPETVDAYIAERELQGAAAAAAPEGVDARFLESGGPRRYRILSEAQVGGNRAALEAIIELTPGEEPPYRVQHWAEVAAGKGV